MSVAEHLNPGGSVKDRAALGIIEDFEGRGLLKPGGVIVEGTAGNTGIGLTLVGNARGYRTIIVMPDDQAPEKYALLRTFGAMVEMAHWLLRESGLFLGGSAALNVVGAARYAATLPAGSRVVTILCDGGDRYRSRIYDAAWLAENELTPQAKDLSFL